MSAWERRTTQDGKTYYANLETKETSWTAPDEGAARRGTSTSGSAGANGNAGDWVRKVHETTGREYWANARLRKTQWERPAGVGVGGGRGGASKTAARPEWEKRYHAASGRTYYANINTQKTSWVAPPAHLVIQQTPQKQRGGGSGGRSSGKQSERGGRERGGRDRSRDRGRRRGGGGSGKKKSKAPKDPRHLTMAEARYEVERQKEKAKKAIKRVAELEEELNVPMNERSPSVSELFDRKRVVGGGVAHGQSSSHDAAPASAFMAALAAAKMHRAAAGGSAAAHLFHPATPVTPITPAASGPHGWNLLQQHHGVVGHTPQPAMMQTLLAAQAAQAVATTPLPSAGFGAGASTPAGIAGIAGDAPPKTPEDLSHPVHAMHRAKVDALVSQQKIAALSAGASEAEAHAHAEELAQKMNAAHLAEVAKGNATSEAAHIAQAASDAAAASLVDLKSLIMIATARRNAVVMAKSAADAANRGATEAKNAVAAATVAKEAHDEIESEHLVEARKAVAAGDAAAAIAVSIKEAAAVFAAAASMCPAVARSHQQCRANWTRTECQWRLNLDERCLDACSKLPFSARFRVGASAASTSSDATRAWEEGLVWIAKVGGDDEEQANMVAWSQPFLADAALRIGQFVTPRDYVTIDGKTTVKVVGDACVVNGEGICFEFVPGAPSKLTALQCQNFVNTLKGTATLAVEASAKAGLKRVQEILRALPSHRADEGDEIEDINLDHLQNAPDILDALLGVSAGVPNDLTDRDDAVELFNDVLDEVLTNDKEAATKGSTAGGGVALISATTLLHVISIVNATYPASSRACKVRSENDEVHTAEFDDSLRKTLGINVPLDALKAIFDETSGGESKEKGETISPEQFAASMLCAQMFYDAEAPEWPVEAVDAASDSSKVVKEGACKVCAAGALFQKEHAAWIVIHTERIEFFYNNDSNPGSSVPESLGWDVKTIASIKVKKKGKEGKKIKKGKNKGGMHGAVDTQFVIVLNIPKAHNSKQHTKKTWLLSVPCKEHKVWEKTIKHLTK